MKKGHEKAILFFSRTLQRLRTQNQKVYAQPVGSYHHPDKYESSLKEKNIRFWFDKEYADGKSRKPYLLTIECDTEDKIRSAFKMLWADAIVFFLAEEYQLGCRLEASLRKRRFGHGYEEYYLKELHTYGLFFFFEDTHLSLGMLGKRDEIMRAFSTGLVVESELPNLL